MTMPDAISVSFGGLFSITGSWFLIREVIPRFRRNSNGNGSIGAKSPEFLQIVTQTAVRQVFSDLMVPKLDQQTEVLREIRQAMSDNTRAIIGLSKDLRE